MKKAPKKDPRQIPAGTKSGASVEPDLWAVLSVGGPVGPSAPLVPAATEEVPPTGFKKMLLQARWVALDAVSALIWLYVLCQLFVFDVDRALFRLMAAPTWVLDFKFLLFPAATLVAATFFWGWSVLVALLYATFFPFVIFFWKVPLAIYKAKVYQHLVFVMMALHAVAVAVRSTRYHLVSKSTAVIAATCILVAHERHVLIASALVVIILLASACGRIAVTTLKSEFFVRPQRLLLELVVKISEKPIQIDKTILRAGSLTAEQRNGMASTIQKEIVLNRALYVWAYRLQQYRESNLGLLFSSLSYVLLFFGSVAAFFLMNLALYKVAPEQFQSAHGPPSMVAMLLYGLSTLVFSEGGGIAAAGDWAYSFRIAAGLFGPSFFLAAVGGTLLVLRSNRVDVELRDTVAKLRRRAKEHEAEFQQVVRVSVTEACTKLTALGIGGLMGIVNWLQSSLPSEYVEGSADDMPKRQDEGS